MVIRSSTGERAVAMQDFYKGPYETAVGPAEMLVEIRVPLRPHTGSAYAKVDRRVGDWAVVAAGASLTLEQGVIAEAGIALVAVGGEITSTDAERSLIGKTPSDELFAHAAALAAAACDPVTDQRGSAEYKRHVAGVLVERVLERAGARAQQEEEE
jgi:carbon-monoxide dehydrogenase medium subunit